MRRLALFIATVGGLGHAPVAPGTVGSAVGIALAAWLHWIDRPLLEAGAIVGLFVGGAWAASVVESHLARTDPGQVIIDEVVGALLTVAFLPIGWKGAIAGFLLFRLFDILKPPPCRRLEALHGGWGIMADDAMAGIYAYVALRILTWLAPALL
jgi:phosphatidylglycerophosphatase A